MTYAAEDEGFNPLVSGPTLWEPTTADDEQANN
jgi:hypothetical protein